MYSHSNNSYPRNQESGYNQDYSNSAYANSAYANQGYPNHEYSQQGHANYDQSRQSYSNQGHSNQYSSNQGYSNQGYASSDYERSSYSASAQSSAQGSDYRNSAYSNSAYGDDSYGYSTLPTFREPNSSNYESNQSHAQANQVNQQTLWLPFADKLPAFDMIRLGRVNLSPEHQQELPFLMTQMKDPTTALIMHWIIGWIGASFYYINDQKRAQWHLGLGLASLFVVFVFPLILAFLLSGYNASVDLYFGLIGISYLSLFGYGIFVFYELFIIRRMTREANARIVESWLRSRGYYI